MTETIAHLPLWETRSGNARDRDQRFEKLMSPYSRDLYRYAYWLAGDPDVAEDLVQETLFRAWKSLHKLENATAIKSWLFTIVRRENARRFERYQPKISATPPDELRSQYPGYDTSTEAFVLRQALEALPIEYREPLLLQIIGGYSQKEIARMLNISPAGAGTRLFRARQKLRDILAAQPEERSAPGAVPSSSGPTNPEERVPF
jgi:RNA polymerase sigma-70 factor (ECF subfamily)